jgi:hypothetical protein
MTPLPSGEAFVELKYSTKLATTKQRVAAAFKKRRLFLALLNSAASLLSIQKS